ncbi:FAD-dependent oxidoreductase, partial [Pseudomonas aeruginosa]
WVLQASADWSRAHLEDTPDVVEQALLAAFADHIGAASPAIIATSVHRWRYAKTNALDRGAFWNADIRLGACGDWLLGPRIEAAWLS